MSEEAPQAQAATQKSGFIYRTTTRYWPRIAVGLVAVAGIAEWVVGGITSNGTLELYFFAWATTTGGLWFMSEKAEKSLSEDSRNKVVGWIDAANFADSIKSIPSQFALFFDRVFGEKHWSWRCFFRSALASFLAAFLTLVILMAFDLEIGRALRDGFNSVVAEFESVVLGSLVWMVGLALYAAVIVQAVNCIQDYLSLLETRWMIRRMEQRRLVTRFSADFVATATISKGRLVTLLCADFVATAAISMGFLVLTGEDPLEIVVGQSPFSPCFYSTFLTSVWLWLYTASVLVSRFLVKMGGGVGFLLKVTDVEKQPFRSMGFTSVVLVSLLFLVGLPFVLLA